jgi:hypothetical protein
MEGEAEGGGWHRRSGWSKRRRRCKRQSRGGAGLRSRQQPGAEPITGQASAALRQDEGPAQPGVANPGAERAAPKCALLCALLLWQLLPHVSGGVERSVCTCRASEGAPPWQSKQDAAGACAQGAKDDADLLMKKAEVR